MFASGLLCLLVDEEMRFCVARVLGDSTENRKKCLMLECLKGVDFVLH